MQSNRFLLVFIFACVGSLSAMNYQPTQDQSSINLVAITDGVGSLAQHGTIPVLVAIHSRQRGDSFPTTLALTTAATLSTEGIFLLMKGHNDMPRGLEPRLTVRERCLREEGWIPLNTEEESLLAYASRKTENGTKHVVRQLVKVCRVIPAYLLLAPIFGIPCKK